MLTAGPRYDLVAHWSGTPLVLQHKPMNIGDCRYYRSDELIQLRMGIAGARHDVALAYALALHDLGRQTGGDHYDDPEVARLVAVRLLPLEPLAFYLQVHDGGVTAVAKSMNVLPRTVHCRLCNLDKAERVAIAEFRRALAQTDQADRAAYCQKVPTPRAVARRSAGRLRLDQIDQLAELAEPLPRQPNGE